MKKNIMKSIKVLGLCLVLSLFVGVVVVDAQTAPANNIAGPLNVGSSLQTKAGGLDVGTVNGNLRVLNGGFRSGGPSLFDDIVIIGYSEESLGGGIKKAEANKGTFAQYNTGFFSKLAKFFGFNTEKVFADVLGAGNVETGGITPLGSCSPACTGYSTCQLVSAPDNYDCILPACTLNCTSGHCVWGSNGMYCEEVYTPGNEVEAQTGALIDPNTYHLTVNGRSNLNGYSKIEGDLDVAGAITSGGKNVCLQDGTNCVSNTLQTVTQFGGTFTKAGTTCVNKNPVGFAPGSEQCSCAPGFTQYTMAQYSYISNLAALPLGRVITSAPLSYSNTTALPVGNVITGSSVLTMYGCYK